MPTYQYACTECGHDFEQFQGFSDDALTVCPVCQGRLRKVYNAVGVVFKGSGFYRNDSRTDGKNGKDGTATSAGSDSSSGSGTAKESTGDTKSTGTDKAASSSTPASTPASTGSGSSSASGGGSGGAGSTSAA